MIDHPRRQFREPTSGNPVGINIPQIGSAGSTSGTLFFHYDSKYRPDGETRYLGTGLGTTLYDYPFGTDGAGNVTNSRGVSQSVNGDDQIVGSAFTYDLNGNPTTYTGKAFGPNSGGFAMSWDVENHPIGIPGYLTAKYRPDGLRAWKDNASNPAKRTYYVYDGDTLVCEIAGAHSEISAGSVRAAYVYGPNGLLARYDGTDPNNTGYLSLTFDPFGNLVMRQRQFDSQNLPADIATYDSRGHLIADLSRGSGQPLPATDPIGPMSQFGATTDEELKGGGTKSGLQLLSSENFYDPETGKFVDRFGDIKNQYELETLPWRVTSSLVRGAINTAVDTIFLAQDLSDMVTNWTSSSLGIKLPNVGLRIPESWRNPAGQSHDKLEHLSEELGGTTFMLFGTLDAVGGLGRGGIGAAEEAEELAVGAERQVAGEVKEGIYEFETEEGPYVGQSGRLPKTRLREWVRAGRLDESDLPNVKITEVLGGRTAREIAEHMRLQELRKLGPVANIRNPIGFARRHLLPYEPWP